MWYRRASLALCMVIALGCATVSPTGTVRLTEAGYPAGVDIDTAFAFCDPVATPDGLLLILRCGVEFPYVDVSTAFLVEEEPPIPVAFTFWKNGDEVAGYYDTGWAASAVPSGDFQRTTAHEAVQHLIHGVQLRLREPPPARTNL